MGRRSKIPLEMRQLVAERADNHCEYCLIAEVDTYSGCQVDHVISIKHDGLTTLDNLSYACVFCNRHKGSDLGSISRKTGLLTRFFDPRRDKWGLHFKLNGAVLSGLTPVGEVTARILKFNSEQQLIERQVLIENGRYPSLMAQLRMVERAG